MKKLAIAILSALTIGSGVAAYSANQELKELQKANEAQELLLARQYYMVKSYQKELPVTFAQTLNNRNNTDDKQLLKEYKAIFNTDK